MRLIAPLLCAAALFGASASAGAEVIKVPLWEYPGVAPYENTSDPDHNRVAKLHEEMHELSTDLFMRGTRMNKEGKCTSRFLKDGEILWTSFSGASGHHVKQVRVAFKYPKGHEKASQPVLDNDPIRQTADCDLGNGVSILLPAACSNWSVQYRTVPLPPMTQIPTKPVAENCRCFNNDSTTAYSGVYVSGQYLPGCDPDFIPGVSTSGFIDGGAGQTCICQ